MTHRWGILHRLTWLSLNASARCWAPLSPIWFPSSISVVSVWSKSFALLSSEMFDSYLLIISPYYGAASPLHIWHYQRFHIHWALDWWVSIARRSVRHYGVGVCVCVSEEERKENGGGDDRAFALKLYWTNRGGDRENHARGWSVSCSRLGRSL